MFLFSKKVSLRNLFLVISLVFLSHCKQKNQDLLKIKDYKEFNVEVVKASCKKVRECFTYIYRTFPEDIAKNSSLKECESSALKNLDQKIEKHDLKIQALAKSCYTNLLSSNCKTLPLIIVTDPNCALLKSEINNKK